MRHRRSLLTRSTRRPSDPIRGMYAYVAVVWTRCKSGEAITSHLSSVCSRSSLSTPLSAYVSGIFEMRALRLLACFVSALWVRGAFAEMTTFTCPADNNTLQYYDEAPSGRKLYIIRCGTSMLDFLDLNTDVTQSGATRSQCLTLC